MLLYVIDFVILEYLFFAIYVSFNYDQIISISRAQKEISGKNAAKN
jgi:hypothetical protein